MIWDYHVVALVTLNGKHSVFDHSIKDSSSAWPLTLREWTRKSFGDEGTTTKKRYRPKFRLVNFAELSSNFSSNRSHMEHSDAPMPDYPPIMNNANVTTSNLFKDFVNMNPEAGVGEVIDSVETLEMRMNENLN